MFFPTQAETVHILGGLNVALNGKSIWRNVGFSKAFKIVSEIHIEHRQVVNWPSFPNQAADGTLKLARIFIWAPELWDFLTFLNYNHLQKGTIMKYLAFYSFSDFMYLKLLEGMSFIYKQSVGNCQAHERDLLMKAAWCECSLRCLLAHNIRLKASRLISV